MIDCESNEGALHTVSVTHSKKGMNFEDNYHQTQIIKESVKKPTPKKMKANDDPWEEPEDDEYDSDHEVRSSFENNLIM